MNHRAFADPGIEESETLTMRETARELRCSERTVWTLVHSGSIPALRLGRSVRIRREALRQFLAHKESLGLQRESHSDLPE